MKKHNLFLSAFMGLFMTSCANTELIEEATLPSTDGLQKITLNVKTQSDADTRLSVDDMTNYWNVKWSKDDALLGYSYNNTAAQASQFNIDNSSLTDGKTAEFGGNALANSTLCLFYPHTDAPVSNHLLTINLSTQHSSSTVTTSSVEKMYMISEPIKLQDGETTTQSPVMKHLTTQLRVAMKFSNIPQGAKLSHIVLSSIENSSYTNMPIYGKVDLRNGSISSIINGELTIIDDSKTELKENSIIKLHASVLPFKVAAGKKINLDVWFTDYQNNSFKKKFEIVNNTEGVMNFESGKFHELRKICDLSNAMATFSGVGTASEPFLIRNREELELLHRVGTHTPRYYFRVANDFSLGNEEWKPIANFYHHLDGGNFTISDLKIDQPKKNDQALITNIGYETSITNLHVTGTIIGNDRAAGIVGKNDGTIDGCSFDGEIEGNNNLGGICGSHNGVKIINCFNKGKITGKYEYKPDASSACYIGGICGYSYKPVENCYNTGEIYAHYSPGGIVGSGSGKINNCYNTGTITAGSSGMAGAITGLNYGDVTNTYYLEGSAEKGIGGGTITGSAVTTAKTAAEMKTLANTLNTNVAQIAGANQWSDADPSPVFTAK